MTMATRLSNEILTFLSASPNPLSWLGWHIEGAYIYGHLCLTFNSALPTLDPSKSES